MPDDLVKYFDPYGEVAIEDYLLEVFFYILFFYVPTKNILTTNFIL